LQACCCRVFGFWIAGFYNFGHLVMDGRADETVVGYGGDEAID
jgi:hypothetical protein